MTRASETRPTARNPCNWGAAWALVSCVVGLSACADRAPTPERVAQRFWRAVAAGDVRDANELSVRPIDPDLIVRASEVSVSSASFEDALQNEVAAVVPTTVVWSDELAADPVRLSFHTHLVRRGDAWKVEPHRTQEELVRAVITASAKRVREHVRHGVDELGRALERGTDEISKALGSAMKELEEELD